MSKFKTAKTVETVNPNALVLKAAFQHREGVWEPLKPEDLLNTKLGFFTDDVRIILEFNLHKAKYYVVCNEQDYNDLKIKYPKAVVLHLSQLIKLWTGCFSMGTDGSFLFQTVPTVLMAMKYLEGAKVVAVRDVPENGDPLSFP